MELAPLSWASQRRYERDRNSFKDPLLPSRKDFTGNAFIDEDASDATRGRRSGRVRRYPQHHPSNFAISASKYQPPQLNDSSGGLYEENVGTRSNHRELLCHPFNHSNPVGASYQSPQLNTGGGGLFRKQVVEANRQYGQETSQLQFNSTTTESRWQSSLLSHDSTPLKNNNPAVDLGGGFLSTGFWCCQCVRTQEVAISENFGKFEGILYQPGLYMMCWPMAGISGRLSLRVQQFDVECETKTRDNVFIHLQVSVQYRVILDKVFDAYYRLSNPLLQIRTCIYDVVRSTVPRLTLDEVFASKVTVAQSILNRLQPTMRAFGYEIVDSLVTNLSPDPLVKASMNEMNASKRLKEAMHHKAEAGKIARVKAAEAAAEKAHLSGIGSARQRCAVSTGVKDCLSQWTENERVSSKEAIDLLLISQYLETLAAVGSNCLYMRCEPGEVREICEDLPTIHNVSDLLS